MDEQIEKRIEQYEMIFERNPVPFMLYHLTKDSEGNYTKYEIMYANTAATELLHTSKELTIGKTISSISKEKMEFFLLANKENGKMHDIRYDSYCDKYLDITAYQEFEDYIAFVILDVSEQIKQEQNARFERDKYRQLLDTIPGGIAVFDLVRGTSVELSYFNDEICVMTGYSREEILSRGVEQVCEVIPEDSEKTHEQCARAVRENQPVEAVYRTRKKNGELRYFRVRLAIEETKENKLMAYAAYTDVTLQKQAEQAMAAEMQYLSEASGNGLMGRCRVNVTKNLVDNYTSDGRLLITSDNPKYSDAVHYVAELCMTNAMRENFIDRMMPERLMESYKANVHELSLEYSRKMNSGEMMWVRTVVKLIADADSGDIMCFMYTYDIDKEKTMQQIIDHVAQIDFDMLCLLDTEKDQLNCVRASEMELDMEHGIDAVYSVGMPEFIDGFVPAEYRDEITSKMRIETIQEELKHKSVYTLTYPVIYREKKLYKKWDYSYLDEMHRIVIFTRSDVTELLEEQEQQRENLRNALMQAEQASHAKTDFLSHMSHEIRTPMNAIIGMSTLAAQCVYNPEQVSECISKVGISARFLLSLINDILDMSRIESGKVTLRHEKFPFEELINNINSIIYNQAKDKDVDYECIITSFVSPNYIGDEMKLQQILINLLGNAVKFTKAGGKTQFIVHLNKTENGKAYFTFTVNDTGVGISDEFQKKMFEPFERQYDSTTTVYQGTGLGLAITKNLIDMMGGTISVNSIEGVGTEFTVKVALEICEDETNFQVLENIPFEKLYALIVDDDVLICEQTQLILREMGLQTEWVASGEQAISIVEKKHVENKNFDIVLLDWKMPDMDGIETARRLRKIVGPDVTIIVITAYDWSSIEAEAKAAGVNLLVTKPLFKSTLVSAFQKVFSEKVQREEEQPTHYDFAGRHILLVEDHILNVEVAKRLLESKHAVVDVAENGLKAIEKFTLAEDHYYDAILMDIRMPIMDGLTAARSIRQLSKTCAESIPIIAMSANAFDEDIEKSQASGMNAHLSKPIEPELLFATLNRFFLIS